VAGLTAMVSDSGGSFSLRHYAQTGSAAHEAFCPIGTERSFKKKKKKKKC
jgi:hypothetical protein